MYCDHKNQEGQTAEKLVASLTNQLARQYYNWRLAFPAEVKVLYNKEKDKKKDLTLKDHISLFLSLVKYFSKVFVVIDALDECSNSDRGRNIFISALQGLRSSVRMLVTSRNLDYIKEEFKDAVQVDIRADIGDVTVYLENYMKRRVSYGGAFVSRFAAPKRDCVFDKQKLRWHVRTISSLPLSLFFSLFFLHILKEMAHSACLR